MNMPQELGFELIALLGALMVLARTVLLPYASKWIAKRFEQNMKSMEETHRVQIANLQKQVDEAKTMHTLATLVKNQTEQLESGNEERKEWLTALKTISEATSQIASVQVSSDRTLGKIVDSLMAIHDNVEDANAGVVKTRAEVIEHIDLMARQQSQRLDKFEIRLNEGATQLAALAVQLQAIVDFTSRQPNFDECKGILLQIQDAIAHKRSTDTLPVVSAN